MTATNVRLRGKIHRDEWPKIFERFKNGETLAAIARSYECTAPAIRYIIARTRSLRRGDVDLAASRPSGRDSQRSEPVGRRDRKRSPLPQTSSNFASNEIWRRVNTDIATFLAAMDDVVQTDSESAYEDLLGATDRLLWASARTRLELEKVLASRKDPDSRKRISG
jgi:hypothetical protein